MTSSHHTSLYLDDLTVGDSFTSETYQMQADEIKQFAHQFDPQPFHLDEEAASDSVFSGLAASGWHTAAVTMKLIVSSVPLGDGVIGAGTEISWPTPTRPGDEVYVESKVVSVKPSQSKPDRGIVTMQSETYNQRGDLLQRSVAKLLVFRRKAS
ncbi:acyl dehydratase [Paraburkholderia sp. GAS199]|uniref:MaoC family dehydratase n=1 Tax=Paraburkholderia sp. GAS199 TaxID=3035126 RepID=UPI003D22B801